MGGIRGRCRSSPECIQSAVCGQKQAWGGRRGPEPQGVSGSTWRAMGRGLGRGCEPLCAVGTARRSLPQQVGGGRLGVGIRVEQWSLGLLSSPRSLEGRVTLVSQVGLRLTWRGPGRPRLRAGSLACSLLVASGLLPCAPCPARGLPRDPASLLSRCLAGTPGVLSHPRLLQAASLTARCTVCRLAAALPVS